MKKTLKLFGLVALSAFAFSCTKETALDIEKENITPADEQQAETPDTPVIPATDGGLLTSFGVTFEGQQDADAKVTVDLGEGTTAIENGDEVLVYVSASNKAVYAYNKGESKFELSSGGPVTLDAPASVFYPADEFNEETGVFTMPAAVTSIEDLGDKAPMAGQIEEGTAGAYTVDLKNLASVLKVGVTGATSNTLTSVTLAATGKSVAESAAYTVDFSGARPVLATEAADAASSMVVSAGGAALSGTAQPFYFLVPAGLSLGDVTVTATLGEDHNGGNNTFSISQAAFTPVPKKITTMSFYAGLFSGGTGEASDPYIIANARDFKYISKYCAEGYADGSISADDFLKATYKQTADINFKGADLSEYMIGGADTPFTGTYNGSKTESTQYTLSNFTISGSPSGNEGVAPFKAVNNATLQNISISGAEVTGGKFTAGLVGYANGASLTITGCSISSSTISASGDYGAAGLIGGLYAGTVSSCSGKDLTIGATNTEGNKRYYGGLISYARGTTTTISKCSLNGTTTVNGTPAYFGGIAGQTNEDGTTITGCENHSDISGAGNFAGGIVGIKTKGSIEGCTNDGSVGGAQYVGGIAGSNAAGNILGCTNEGAIVSKGIAGGIAGQVTGGTIKDCTNESSATFSVSGATVGGIAGTLTGGTITASDGRYTENKADIDLGVIEGYNNVGGIVGQLEGAITNVKNSGAITGYYNIGGIGGTITTNGSVENALSSGDVSGYQNVGGISGKHGHNANAAITKKITLKNCHVDGADITASANDGRAGGIAGLVFAGSWIEGCTAFRGTVSGHQDVGGAIGHLQYASSSTDKSNRIYVGANMVSMDVSGLNPINNTSRIGGFFGYFQNNKDAYTFAYQNGVVGGSITAEGCNYVGSFVGYASVSSNKGRIWDSYSLIEDANFHVTTSNANIGGFAGAYGNANVNSVRNAHVNSQNTSAATSGITATTVANIRTVELVHAQGYELPSCNVDGSAYTTTTWSNPDDVNYPVPTILVTYGHYK